MPTSGVLGTSWTEADFDDAGWSAGATGVGFGADYVDLVGIGLHRYQRKSDTTYVSLGLTAVREALADAGISCVTVKCMGQLPPSYMDFTLSRGHAD